ncbi:MAG: 2-dehydropantoate 2-reductase N-terminal domain-containing protein, partial [Eubacteriales bacterium]|nr:2-dehydropantoate 2-reductase N-terminal domain-containing protein [Eubacteriales bacterium]
MDILIVGLGVIGSTYGYLFQKAGHCTEHFIRKDSLKKSVKELQVELFDGRTKTTGEWTKGVYYVHHICKKRKYDFIFVSVPAGGITDVM